ncbi:MULTISPECIES: DMT family transporter [unclassified Iodidimonas]|uniref:DMT family transporter n=1 Tax=unclassified Iodidimonas TaxID=2626145 RepID=UPI0024823D2B|nr:MULTISPECIES: DMT family transporter [unclassified Iodidimonas]
MKPINAPKPADFMGLALLALSWGSSFFFVEFALISFGPLAIAAIRISIAAFLLVLIARIKGHRLPDNRKDWGLLILAGAVGTSIPFSLIAWGQTHINSSDAAILMAFSPLSTLFFAHFMTRDEKITGGKIFGLLLGFMGVIILVGGSEALDLDGGLWPVLGRVAVLTAALGYGFSSLLLRKASRMSSFSSAAGVMIVSAVMIIPFALVFDNPLQLSHVDIRSLLAVIWLGLMPSALAVLVLVILLGRIGATFVALNNYLVPVVGSLLGVFILGEDFGLLRGFGLLLILSGILLTQYVQRRQLRRLRKSL